MSFFAYFFELDYGRAEQQVLCPFPHAIEEGLTYYESNPSAHVNLDKGMFHCKSCHKGLSEAAFIKELLGCSYHASTRLASCFNNDEVTDVYTWDEHHTLSEEHKEQLNNMGLSDLVINQLKIKTIPEFNTIGFPVFMYGWLTDVRQYRPNQKPKVLSKPNAVSGLIIPYDEWLQDKEKVTIICAGEKDMAVARSYGFNAITITGGETALPVAINSFADRKVVICYDNDNTGCLGAERLALELRTIAKSVKICTEFHTVCAEEKEDITDFFMKYNKTKEDLVHYLKQAKEFDLSQLTTTARAIPLMDLHTATAPVNVGKIIQSNIQVVATADTPFIAPRSMLAIKYRDSVTGDTMQKGAEIEWILDENNIEHLLHFMDNNFKEETIYQNKKKLMRVPVKEKHITVKTTSKATIYKCYVTDMFETTHTDAVPTELTAYAIDTKLESGKKYLVTYKLIAHPYKGQALTMMILKASQASDSVSQFKITSEVKEHLKLFQNIEGTIPERIEKIINKFKGWLGYDGHNRLIRAMDFSYHTPLIFDFGSHTNERAYLDTLIVGESRTGKSSTAEAMRTTYGLGTFTSLAGNATTIAGLIGGSNKLQSGYQTKAGLIPQNHRGLIIFEELGKSNANIMGELTDIRSSNEVRIARVSGTIVLPAFVRMITLTNVKTENGLIKPIAQYPNGISILTELIGTAEDIARYDIALILEDTGPELVDPFWEPEETFPIEALRARVRWIWSRTKEQIVINRDVGRYATNKGNELNAKYGGHIKIFGTEAYKKVCRIAIAVAGYLVSTDDSYEKIIVTKEHVDYAYQFFVETYDNPTFKLKEYVEYERKYANVDQAGLDTLQDIFIKCPLLLLHLEQLPQTSKNALQAATGLTNDAYNAQLTRLTKDLFVVFNGHHIVPTQRFRIGMTLINRRIEVERVGTNDAVEVDE